MDIKGLIALAFGTLGLGITEYVAMGLLPYLSADFSVTIAQAGHAISAYALGVAIGAFMIIFMRKLRLKSILLILILIHLFGNALTCVVDNFNYLLISRFIAGLPHGCFFGVGSIIAQRLVKAGKGTSAVAIMTAGMTVANVFGVPLGTALANSLSWRVIFIIVAVWALFVLLSAVLWIRDVGGIEDRGFKNQFTFMKTKSPWLVLGATMFGNAGIFCMMSYVSPLLTDLGSVSLEYVPAVMVCMGSFMVAFNLISGKLCDHFTPGIVASYCQLCAVVLLLIIALLGQYNALIITLICLNAGLLFAISSPEQVAILHTAPAGLLVAASCVQAAFNLGNAIGAYAGGIPFTFDLSIRLVTVIGAALALIGFVSLFVYARKYEKTAMKEYFDMTGMSSK